MLFNSYPFLLGFLPITLLAFFAIAKRSPWLGAVALTVASLFFYGWWDVRFVPLLVGSAAFNYSMSRWIISLEPEERRAQRKWILVATIAANLLLLGYFKYILFVVATLNNVFGLRILGPRLPLPLGISFFTFTQIAFVVDAYRSQARERDPIRYLLFVTWFPHLIAGPVLHHKDTMPQFARAKGAGLNWVEFAAASAMFTIGLFKKVVLADGIGYYVSSANALSAFTKAGVGLQVGFFDGWAAALAYTLQLYFDFSGYSDMAIGLSLMFGVRFPVNFNSPYKAVNVIEFWRRWHMTLSQFLRDYLYVPLGGNRKGPIRRYLNLFLTMVIGGLWHGAGWTFVAWGALHGLYLVINHLFRALRSAMGTDLSRSTLAGRFGSRALTLGAVVIGWVFFRSVTLAGAVEMLSGMAGLNGFVLLAADRAALGPVGEWLAVAGTRFEPALQMSLIPIGLWILALLPIALWMPNSQEILGRFPVVLERFHPDSQAAVPRISWRPSISWAIAAAVLFTIAFLNLTKPSEFLYYQF